MDALQKRFGVKDSEESSAPDFKPAAAPPAARPPVNLDTRGPLPQSDAGVVPPPISRTSTTGSNSSSLDAINAVLGD
eukprot:CAMPEP_0198225458 /NCGR_PEP_ID=MMETSP1445-20131203/101173_1 /TAXON_ID=36898 /ORGANISM="Pyramimonas sp., Strain CCMP2087" /LENGTH=76 /DNA_ID=CAMNT_0043904985 /DNA_START=42 /DNA_END=269 /DNA_ORIENTATION=-